jgi:predicted transcriptional regulator
MTSGKSEQQDYKHLGDLELQIMNVIWDRSRYCSVSEVHEALYPVGKLAYTTIMTVMGNLHKKGVLKRKKEGKAYLYAPARKREEMASGAIQKITRMYYRNNIPEFFRCFLRSQGKLDREQIEELKEKLGEFEREAESNE